MTSIISRVDAPASVSAVTSTRLADGRELLFFDDTAHPLQRPSRDRRDLPERGPSGEIRYDALTGEWVAVAAHRQHRTHLPPADECPLCPSTDARPRRSRRITTSPCLKTASPRSARISPRPRRPTPPAGAAAGRRRPVRSGGFTPAHTGTFAALSTRRVRTVIDAWAHRTEASQRPARRGAGVLLREPRPGHRRDTAPPARADLRLPLCHAAGRGDGRGRPAVPSRRRAGRPP